MPNEPTWQTQAVEQLSQIFDKDSAAKAFILTGSLAAADIQADAWSDVDAKIILADHALDRYHLSLGWLSSLGRLIGTDRHENHLTKTVRVCLEGFRRFDLTFISESAWQNPSSWDHNPVPPPYAVVWSKLPAIETQIASFPFAKNYEDMPLEDIQRMVDTFWFKAAVAIGKVVRNDLLIGTHLALDLARDALVLQMIRRDKEKRTTIHRIGGWGNEVVARFTLDNRGDSGEEILDFIRLSCEVFDGLASELLPNYHPRGPLLYPSIELAKAEPLRERKMIDEP